MTQAKDSRGVVLRPGDQVTLAASYIRLFNAQQRKLPESVRRGFLSGRLCEQVFGHVTAQVPAEDVPFPSDIDLVIVEPNDLAGVDCTGDWFYAPENLSKIEVAVD